MFTAVNLLFDSINGGYHASSPPTRSTRDYNEANDFAAIVLLEASYFSIAQRHSCRSQGKNPNGQIILFLERIEQGHLGRASSRPATPFKGARQPDMREPNRLPTCHLGLKIYRVFVKYCVFSLNCWDSSQLCQFCCSSGVIPAI